MDNVTRFLKESKKRGYHTMHYRDKHVEGGCRVKMYLRMRPWQLEDKPFDTVGFTCLVKEYINKFWQPSPFGSIAVFYFASHEIHQV